MDVAKQLASINSAPPPPGGDNLRTGILRPGQTMTSYIGRSVINLSDVDLTEAQSLALSKGLTYCPTPWEPDMSSIINSLEDLFRRMRLKTHFFKLDKNAQEAAYQAKMDANKGKKGRKKASSFFTAAASSSAPLTPTPPKPEPIWKQFKPKSTFNPQVNEEVLDSFCRQVRFDTLKSPVKKIRWSNLSKDERKGLTQLEQNPDLTIKKADKGSAVVIMNTSDYIVEAERQLLTSGAYLHLDHDPTTEYCKDIQRVLDTMLTTHVINAKCHEYLSPTTTRPGRFYLLPKIHKKGVPGRPICSSVNHPTERISQFVDAHIRRFMMQSKSYIRDTQDFISKIVNGKPRAKGTILVTLDVTSLYTNIPNEDGIAAIAKLLNESPDPDMPTPFLLKLLKLVLSKNYFIFNGEFYLQIGGTAMGTKLAPSYACSFLGDHENTLLANYPLQPDHFLRFIDDLYFEWIHGEDELLKFIQYLNDGHPYIKFTSEYSPEEINFLDTTVKIDPVTRQLYTTLYSKPTDTQDYLEFSSCHPEHCKLGGPKGQMIRLRRICTRDVDFESNLDKLCEAYRRRNYPERILRKHRLSMANMNQNDLIQVVPPREQLDRLLLILEYNPANPDVLGYINQHWGDLESSSLLSEIFTKPPMLVHKRCKNLSDMLVRANTTYPKPDPGGKIRTNFNGELSPCKTPFRCKCCPKKSNQLGIKCTVTQQTYKLPTLRLSCQSKNLVYALECSVCHKQYVGETKRTFKERTAEHLGDIKNLRLNKPLGKHFNLPGHKFGTIKTFILELIRGDPEATTTTSNRKAKEHFWIMRLRSCDPFGLNCMNAGYKY
jgi:hypothetical protein